MTKGERAFRGFDFNPKAGVMTYLANDFQHPGRSSGRRGTGWQRRVAGDLTHLNAALWEGNSNCPVKVERLPYKSSDGWEIDGVLREAGGLGRPARKYPMVLSVHGGPAGQYGVDWYHEFQVYAAKGWAVFFCNPRGSTGYGEKFERGIVNNWGGMDYQDVMAGVDAAIKQNAPWLDTERMGVTGEQLRWLHDQLDCGPYREKSLPCWR